jgi:foldase protein PrsA
MGIAPGARQRGSAALLFAGFAALALFTAGCGEKPVAVVNGEALTEKEFHRLNETATRIDPQRGAVGLQTLSNWINSTVMAQEAKRLNVYPSEKDLETRLDAYRRQAAWMGTTMEEQLQRMGIDLETFKRELLNQLITENVMFRGITVSDQELQEAWDKQKQMFVQPEQVRISQITVDSQEEMKKAQADLAGNADFALVARTRSQDQFKDQGGEVPFPLARQIQPGGPVAQEVVDVAFKLKPGEVSDPVKVGATWVFVKLAEKIPAKEPKLEDFRELLRSNLRQQKGQASPEIQKNQQELMQAQQSAKVEINRPQYASLQAQVAAAGRPGMPPGDGPPPAPGH